MSRNNLGIYKRGAVFWLSWTIAGKRYRESLQTTDENEAVIRAMEWRGSPGLLLSRELEGEIEDYLAERLADRRLRPVTAHGRRYVLRAFCEATQCRALHDLTPGTIAAWYEARKKVVALCTADLHLKAVRAFCRWLAGKGRLRFSPASTVRPRTTFTPARVDFCDAATSDRLIEAAETVEMRFILLAGFDAGLRRNEIVQARRSWFNLDAGSITVAQTATFIPKTGRGRSVPLTLRFRDFMREHFGKVTASDFILSPELPVSKNEHLRLPINVSFKAFMIAQDCPSVTPHTMRRTFASLRVSAGVSIYKVAAWLGDRIATAERHYAHMVPVDDDIERVHRPSDPLR